MSFWFLLLLLLLFCREYNLYLPRKEVEEVDNLRDEWVKLITLAEKVSELWNINLI